MDAATKRNVDLVLQLVGEQLGEQLREIRALRRDLDQAKREIVLLKIQERSRRSVRRAANE
jgi:hypothetical protein